MNYGLYISASGALTALYRQDVLAGNLANLGTVGFKPDIAATRQRDPVRLEDDVAHLPSNELLERLGAGAQAAPNRVSFTQGSLQSTGNDLDLAIEGDGFFVVRLASDGSTDRLRLTRDGRFSLDSRSRLVTATEGLPVLDVFNRAITIPDATPVSFDPDGTIRQNNEPIARLQVTDVPDRTALRKEGESLFTAAGSALNNRTTATGKVRQGMLENSAVDEIKALMGVTAAARHAQGNIGMITYHDRLMELAINRFGRVT